MREIIKLIFRCVGGIISRLLRNQSIFKKYNYLFEHSSRSVIRFFVKYVNLPNVDNTWKINLLNGEDVLTKIDKDNLKTGQFALSYKWHSPSLNFTEKLLNDYYPIDIPWIDVGANLGLRSLLSLSENRPVFFIEPNKEVNLLNIDRCELNNFKNYKLFEVGASDKKGTIEFTIDKSSYNSTIEKDSLSEDIVDHQEFIQIDTIDNLFATQIKSFKTACIKIDVEGHELKVLVGGKDSISTWSPTLVIEVNKRGEHLSEFIDFFSDFGYDIFEIGEFGKKYFKRVVKSSSHDYAQIRFNDFLVVKDDELLNIFNQYAVK